MGLLDGNLDPQTMAQLQLAGGLLSPGSFGQGLSRGISGYQGALANSQNYDINSQKLAMEKLQFAAQLRNQNLINDYMSQAMGGGQPAQSGQQPAVQQPSQPSIMADSGSTPDFMRVPSSPASGGPPQPTQPVQQGGGAFGGLPASQVMPSLVFNQGKDMAELVQKYHTMAPFRAGGFGQAPDGTTEQFPTVPEGYTAQRGTNGQWNIVPVSGGLDAVAATAAAHASGPAGYKVVDYIGGADGRTPMKGFAKDVVPGFSGGSPSQTPPPVAAGSGAPGSPSAAQMQAVLADNRRLGSPPFTVNGQPFNSPPGAAPAPAQPSGIQSGFAPGVVAGADKGAENLQNSMSDSFKAVLQGNQPAQTVQARLDDISEFAKTAILGGDTQWRDYANNLLSLAGVSDRATDRKSAGDLLDKNASQIALAIGSGSQGTDAMRTLAQAAYPGRHMTQDAINGAVAQLQAASKVAQAKAQVLTPLFTAAGVPADQKASNYLAAEQEFDKNADYRLWQISADTKGMNPQQIVSYLQSKHYTPAQVAQFQSQRKALAGLGVSP